MALDRKAGLSVDRIKITTDRFARAVDLFQTLGKNASCENNGKTVTITVNNQAVEVEKDQESIETELFNYSAGDWLADNRPTASAYKASSSTRLSPKPRQFPLPPIVKWKKERLHRGHSLNSQDRVKDLAKEFSDETGFSDIRFIDAKHLFKANDDEWRVTCCWEITTQHLIFAAKKINTDTIFYSKNWNAASQCKAFVTN